MKFLNDMFGVAGKRVLVTGGSRGIGLAIADGFVRAGARVYICGRDPAACESAAVGLSARGTCVGIPANIASADGRMELIAALREREEALDVLVNNAGALWAAPLAEYPEKGWDKVYDLNVKAAFFLIQQLLPMLEAAASKADPARIINIGSANGLRIPEYETYAYVSSKAALHQLTRHIAGQVAARAITANVIAPGRFPTKMQEASIAERGEEEIAGPVPLGRLGNATDIAAAAIYLASRAGAYVTGAILSIDGGMATTV